MAALLFILSTLARTTTASRCDALLFPGGSVNFHEMEIPETLEWGVWKRIFGKIFVDDSEEMLRRKVFNSNVEQIAKHNARADRGLEGFRMGVNQFSALTHNEFVRAVNLRPVKLRNDTNREEVFLPKIGYGETTDWRTKGAVTPVKNQGQCGSCWAFSTTGSVEGALFLSSGQLRSLSEQQLVDCSQKQGNHGCEGGLMDNGFAYILANKGIDSEKDYNYTGIDGTCWTSAASRVVGNIDGHKDVPSNNEDQLAAAILLQPVSVAIEADQPAFQHYKSGIFDAACGTKLDHGVLVVGMTTDAYIVKNSWGPSWGDAGYIMMKRNTNSSGICGIAMQASYPTRAKGPAPPVPPPTPGPRPAPPASCTGCTPHDIQMCGAFGMHCCCHNSNGTTCHPSTECCCGKFGKCKS